MNTFNYSAFPFVRLLFPFLAGRILSLFYTPSFRCYLLVFVLTVLVVVFLSRTLVISYSKRWMVGLAIFCVFLGLGLINKPHNYFDLSLLHHNHRYKGVVKQVVKSTNNQQSLIVTITHADSSALYYFDALMYLKNVSDQALLPGDQIAFYGRLGEMQYTRNPFAFEYADYMKDKGICGQFFVKCEDVTRLGKVFSLNRIFYLTQQKAAAKLRLLPLNTEEFAIVSALVLGNKSMLDYQTKVNFSRAGAIHVLSISGLHVGIVFIMLTTFMGQIGKGTVALLKVLLVILVLWFYAAISGMSPSVTRATLMFSVFVVAKWKSQQYNIYHSMAIAAFVILVINPYAVTHPGFWLSFLAVGSIVYFYPRVNGWLYFSSPWAKYIWSLVAVSISAQIGTLVLSLYLFDFFPTWFILSNLLIIPILPIMLVGALLVVVFPADSMLVYLLGESLASMFRYLNQITAHVGSLPFARYTGLQLEFYQVFVFYAMLFFCVLWQQLKRGKYLIYTLLFLWMGLVGLTVSYFNRFHQKIFAVHQIKGKTAVTLTAFNRCACWINQPLAPKEEDYALWPLALHQHARSISYHRVDSLRLSSICNRGKNILMVNGEVDEHSLVGQADVIVFTAKLNLFEINEWLNYIDNQVLVFDASFSYSQCKYLRKEVQNRSLNAHFVTLDGAFVTEI